MRIVRNLGLGVAAIGSFLEFSLYDGKLLLLLFSKSPHASGLPHCILAVAEECPAHESISLEFLFTFQLVSSVL